MNCQQDVADIWVTFHYDRSAVVVFDNELDALRYAIDNHMTAKRVIFGQEISRES